MWSTSSLAILPGPLWPGVLVTVSVPSIGQIRLVGMTLNCIWWWGSNSRAFGNMLHLFIGNTPRSTMTWSSCNYGSNKFIPDIGLGVRVFANGPGDLGSIPGRVIPKTQKMVLDTSLLNTQHYKGKVEQSREGVAPSPTHWCSSYRKGSLRVTLDYGRQLYFTY